LKLFRTFSGEFGLPINDPEILPQHNQTRPHESFKNQEAIQKPCMGSSSHTPYRSYLASSDFHLFGALKGAIRGERFASCDGVMEEVAETTKFQPVQKKDRHSCFSLT
jgi:hypothetical protein